jgi:hypothetical protein
VVDAKSGATRTLQPRDRCSRSILSKQIKVDQEQFWAAVDGGSPPERPEFHPPAKPAQTMPLWLHERLRRHLGYTDDQLGTMSREEAQRRFNEGERGD